MRNAIYWDTSALLKVYTAERDSSAYVRLMLSHQEDIAISWLHPVEMFYAMKAKELRGEIREGKADRLFQSFESHIEDGRYLLVPWGSDVEKESRRILQVCLQGPDPVRLRTLDGMHLGATSAGGIRKLITADVRMGDAAKAAGMELVNPE